MKFDNGDAPWAPSKLYAERHAHGSASRDPRGARPEACNGFRQPWV